MSYENFAYYYDSLMAQEFYDDYLQFILDNAKCDTVLEIGCGTGEIAIRLAKLGKMVCATDLSSDMLEVARMKCLENNVQVLLSRIDMRDFQSSQPLDCILCLCDSINYVLKKSEVRQTFENCYRSLKKDGTFIFDIDSMHKMNVILNGYDEENDEEDFYFHWHVDLLEPGYVKHTVEIIDKTENDRVYEEHLQKTFDLKTYLKLLKDAGFKSVEYYSDFNEYKEECERIIFVCRKG